MAREVLGTGECHDCGARIQVAINKNRKLYYFCDGIEDPAEKQCGAQFRWSKKTSLKMIAEAAAAQQPPHWRNNLRKGTNDNDDEERDRGEHRSNGIAGRWLDR